MARRGRKRKDRAVGVEPRTRDMGTPELWRHRQEACGGNPVLAKQWDGTLLHSLFLREKVSDKQYRAASCFRIIVNKYDSMLRMLGKPPNNPVQLSEAQGRERADVSWEDYLKAKDAYKDAYEAIGPYKCRRAVADVLRDAQPRRLVDLTEGLDNLVWKFRL